MEGYAWAVIIAVCVPAISGRRHSYMIHIYVHFNLMNVITMSYNAALVYLKLNL